MAIIRNSWVRFREWLFVDRDIGILGCKWSIGTPINTKKRMMFIHLNIPFIVGIAIYWFVLLNL